MNLELTIEPDMQQLAQLNDQLERRLADQGVHEERVDQVRLIVEELASNAILHGQCTQLRVSLRLKEDALELELDDAGRAFNPCAGPDPDLDAPLESRPVGGLGLFMVRKLADQMQYRRDADRNIVSITLLDPYAPVTEGLS